MCVVREKTYILEFSFSISIQKVSGAFSFTHLDKTRRNTKREKNQNFWVVRHCTSIRCSDVGRRQLGLSASAYRNSYFFSRLSHIAQSLSFEKIERQLPSGFCSFSSLASEQNHQQRDEKTQPKILPLFFNLSNPKSEIFLIGFGAIEFENEWKWRGSAGCGSSPA